MKYDFDKIVNRRGTNAVKWEAVSEDVLPMWVADMDFETVPKIKERLIKRVENGAFGYVDFPENYYGCQIKWWEKRHQFSIKKEWIEFCTGVIPSLSSSVAALLSPGDKVIIQTPVYNYFNTSIVNNGCEIVLNELIFKDNHYEMDYKSFEDQIVAEKVKMFILCNPHNPVGRVWTKDELQKIGDICLKHGVYVVSDEIHGDLILRGYKHVPFISVDPRFKDITITCTAPSKTFNLAGLKNSNMIIPNPDIKKKVNRAANDKEVAESNVFGIEGLIGAYEDGEEWLEDLLDYLSENRQIIKSFVEEELPNVKLVDAQGTYLAWLDCSYYEKTSSEIMEILVQSGKVRISSGSQFGAAGDGFIRINFACPRSLLVDGLNRIKKGLLALED